MLIDYNIKGYDVLVTARKGNTIKREQQLTACFFFYFFALAI